MSYSSGGLIEAVDYNTFAQGGASVDHGTANINTIWGNGTGDKGYGQSTTLSTVSGSSTQSVTATQWATLLTRLNSILTHQRGTGSGVTLPTTGATISYLSTLSSNISTAFSNRLTFNSSGSDYNGTGWTSNWNVNSLNAQPTTFQIVRTATFASADQARYFFNSGGQLVLTMSGSNLRGGSKGDDWVGLIGSKLASHRFGPNFNARGGSGGTVTASNTSLGYWGLTTTNQTMLTLTSASGTADYGGNLITLSVRAGHVSIPQGLYGDKGFVVVFTIDFNDTAADTNTAVTWTTGGYNGNGNGAVSAVSPVQGDFNDTLNLNITTNITVRPPEETNLSNSWGTVSIS
jgi:hypothetical protein